MKEKVVLAYSGGLDTSCCIKMLRENYKMDVITVTVDVGQKEDFEKIRERALNLGVEKAYVIDKKDEFVKEYIVPSIISNSLYEDNYPLFSALSRPLIAKTVVEIAKKENAQAVAHGCTGKGNDQVRFDLSFKILAPEFKIIAPIREYSLSRPVLIDYAKESGIPVSVTKEKPYSIDENLWGRSIGGGILEDAEREIPEDVYELTRPLNSVSDSVDYIEIYFEKGIPKKINDMDVPLWEIIKYIDKIAGAHGFGRIDHIESRVIGLKSREVYEAPSALTLIHAHKTLEYMTLPKELLFIKKILEEYFSRFIYSGLWFSPMSSAIIAFMEKTQEHVIGKIKIKFDKGKLEIAGRESPFSLYQQKIATYENFKEFDSKYLEGFIKFMGLDLVLYSKVEKEAINEYILEEIQ